MRPKSLLAATLLALSSTLPAQTTPSLTGAWTVTIDLFGGTRFYRMNLEQQSDKLTGDYTGDKLEGNITGSNVHLLAKDDEGGTEIVTATLTNGAISGTIIETHVGEQPITYTFTAVLRPARPTAPPQRHEFTPTVFHHQFSPHNPPVLTVNPGDTIHTTTVDAGGTDGSSVKRTYGGNPQTGPFYINSAMPGDVLVVHITRLRLNRDWAGSDDAIVESGLNSELAVKAKDNGKSIRWHIDQAAGTASPEPPSEHLAHYTIQLRPMLGCIATAVGPSSAPPPTGDSGGYGGNMDFNEITEGATVYLPVLNPGALLYLGDAHAAQGDGEINGNALETSADVEFTVDVIPNKNIHGRRVETPTHLIALGYEGSLDEAFRSATDSMALWLAEDYKLTPSEIAQVIGTAAEYKVTEVADRNSGIALKINKAHLRPLAPVGK